ncbi:Ribonuclease H-like superfamily [Sesbania bispinosa]|nr:Ribonuclease H-like superfamily [Sesbania bispinosa]
MAEPMVVAWDETETHILRDCVKVHKVWDLLLRVRSTWSSFRGSFVDWIFTNVSATGWVKWNLDGSVIGPGSLASSGCVLRDSDGRWLHGLARNIGSTFITCAELWAFKDATQASLQRGLILALA